MYNDNHGSPLPVGPNSPEGCYEGLNAEQCGLHDAYSSGDLALNSDQPDPARGNKADARMAEFRVGQTSLNCGNAGLCLAQDGATGGSNAWAMLALSAASQQFRDVTYLNDSITIANWIVANLQDSSSNNFGGYFLGYKDGATPRVLIRGKSTRNNAEIWAAFSLLAALEASRGNTSASSYWSEQAKVAGDFVVRMFNPAAGGFYAGTVNRNQGVDPCGGSDIGQGDDIVNTCDSLDAASFAILSMAASARYAAPGFTWDLPLRHVLSTFPQTVSAAGRVFEGLGPNSLDAPGISWELTGQTAETCRYLDKVLATASFQDCASKYSAQLLATQLLHPSQTALAWSAAHFQRRELPPTQQCLHSESQCIPKRLGLAPTAWAIMAQQGHNPLAFAAPLYAPASLDFSDVRVGGRATRTVTVSNSGTGPLTLASLPAVTGDDAGDFSITGGSCAAKVLLVGHATCSIKVTFAPSKVGSHNATLIFSDNGVGSPRNFSLRGNGQSSQAAPPAFTPAGESTRPLNPCGYFRRDAGCHCLLHRPTEPPRLRLLPFTASHPGQPPLPLKPCPRLPAMTTAMSARSTYSIITGAGGQINYAAVSPSRIDTEWESESERQPAAFDRWRDRERRRAHGTAPQSTSSDSPKTSAFN